MHASCKLVLEGGVDEEAHDEGEGKAERAILLMMQTEQTMMTRMLENSQAMQETVSHHFEDTAWELSRAKLVIRMAAWVASADDTSSSSSSAAEGNSALASVLRMVEYHDEREPVAEGEGERRSQQAGFDRGAMGLLLYLLKNIFIFLEVVVMNKMPNASLPP